MRIPLSANLVEIEVKRSRFIAIAEPLDGIENIKARIVATRALHPQANHVVHAAVLGPDGTQFSQSDDHEPKNTAGRPMLEVLKGSGITNILVMVVRYFGGTLLGTGGLVKAYGDATKAVIDTLKTEELIEKSQLSIKIGYGIYEQVRNLLMEKDSRSTEDFATGITIEATVPTIHVQEIVDRITDLSSGSASVEVHHGY
jgi:uncharacterized YigZ family protein